MGIALWLEQNIGTRVLMLHDKLYKATDGRIGHRIPLPGVAVTAKRRGPMLISMSGRAFRLWYQPGALGSPPLDATT